MSRSFYAPPAEDFTSSRRYTGSVDVRQRSSSVERMSTRREERSGAAAAREERQREDRGDSRSTGSTSSILSDAERELEDMKRVVSGSYDSRGEDAKRRLSLVLFLTRSLFLQKAEV